MKTKIMISIAATLVALTACSSSTESKTDDNASAPANDKAITLCTNFDKAVAKFTDPSEPLTYRLKTALPRIRQIAVSADPMDLQPANLKTAFHDAHTKYDAWAHTISPGNFQGDKKLYNELKTSLQETVKACDAAGYLKK
ncbi:hypothetical protein [Trueperella sp. LYQ143]|uniref:hypothetical protein n=1 Tax=unclassified Trueperella TaxID=2630174 RepID=UPI00398311DA